MKRREEVPGGLVITWRDATELFRPTEEVLDQMSSFVQRFVICSGTIPVPLWWDHGDFSRRLERLDHPLVGVIRLVREQRVRRHSGHQRIRSGEVVDLPGG